MHIASESEREWNNSVGNPREYADRGENCRSLNIFWSEYRGSQRGEKWEMLERYYDIHGSVISNYPYR